MSVSNNGYIWRDDKNVPYITGTPIKVIEVVRDYLGHGWNPEQIHEQHPHLTLAQIHAALAYYYDHKEELDQDMANRDKMAEELRAILEDRALAERLRMLKMQKSRS